MPHTPSQENNSFEEKRLGRALKHVNDLWIPPNAALLQRLKKGLREGAYDLDLRFLINDIKSDYSLFTYCIRELSKLLKKRNQLPASGMPPVQLMQFGGLECLREVLNADERSISKHTLGVANDLQAMRLRGIMISAGVAETLSEKEQIDPDLGFSAAVLRQLGHTLIAWNYPTVYRRAMTSLSDGKSLDLELSVVLGFSPTLLAVRILNSWGLSGDIVSSVDGNFCSNVTPEHEPTPQIELAQRLEKICKIGEALARANDPEHYPSASADWELAKFEIENRLGKDALGAIEEKVSESLQNYAAVMPATYKGTKGLNPEAKIYALSPESLINNNPYVEQCPSELKAKLKEAYSYIRPKYVSKENLRFLVKTAIPAGHFTAGCIYTVDPGTMNLMPRLRLGQIQLRALGPVNYVIDFPDADPILTAYRIDTPIIEDGPTVDGQASITYIAGSIGKSERTGVLYLEFPSEYLKDEKVRPLVAFKAIRQALNDCLNLN